MNVDTLSRPELLTLLSILEGELEAQDVVVHAIRVSAALPKHRAVLTFNNTPGKLSRQADRFGVVLDACLLMTFSSSILWLSLHSVVDTVNNIDMIRNISRKKPPNVPSYLSSYKRH